MAAKKKSAQTDEPVIVEEVEENENLDAQDSTDTQDTDTVTDTPAQDPPSGDSAESDSDTEDTTEPESTTTEEPAPSTDNETEVDDDPAPAAGNDEPDDMDEPKLDEQQDTRTDNPSDFFGTPPEEKKGGFPKGVMAVLALLLVGGGVAAYMFLKPGGDSLGVTTEATPEPTPEMVEATPAPEVDLTEYHVQVLNGSGTAGEAGKVKALLVSAGFDEEAVDTGNASSQSAKVTTVSAKAGVPRGAVEAAEKALSGSFEAETDNDLDEDSEFDIVVTTGGSTDSEEATDSAEDE